MPVAPPRGDRFDPPVRVPRDAFRRAVPPDFQLSRKTPTQTCRQRSPMPPHSRLRRCGLCSSGRSSVWSSITYPARDRSHSSMTTTSGRHHLLPRGKGRGSRGPCARAHSHGRAAHHNRCRRTPGSRRRGWVPGEEPEMLVVLPGVVHGGTLEGTLPSSQRELMSGPVSHRPCARGYLGSKRKRAVATPPFGRRPVCRFRARRGSSHTPGSLGR